MAYFLLRRTHHKGSRNLTALLHLSGQWIDAVHRRKPLKELILCRGTAEQWIKEGKNAVKWTKLSCRTFKDNQTRLQ